MLIAVLIGALLFGGGAAGSLVLLGGKTPQEVAKAFATVESDKAARQRVDDVLDLTEKEAQKLAAEHAKLVKETLKLMERHDATAESFRQLSTRLDAFSDESNRTLLDLRFMLKRQIPDSQWRTIFAQGSASAAPGKHGNEVALIGGGP